MKGILAKLLEKRGIKRIEELDAEEKATFENWDKVLSKDELTLEDVKQFCRGQLDVIEAKWKDLNTENAKKAELIPYHTTYKTLLAAIDAPRSAREQLEQHLNQLLQI